MSFCYNQNLTLRLLVSYLKVKKKQTNQNKGEKKKKDK